ncbi:MAG: hypothetical protein D9V44_01855 [Actinobacteria bacterium]|nr:MAG: hypothetical protein D9V44_01855 [Actinomycetota bacterium]
MKRLAVMTAMVLALSMFAALAVPDAAVGVPAGAVLVSSTEQTVSGAEVAAQVLENLNKVALGSGSATVTMDVDGTPHDISLDVGELAAGGSVKSGLGGVAVIAAIAAGLFKGAALLVRLLR